MKLDEKVLAELREVAKTTFKKYEKKINPAHRWDHVVRVINICKKILIYEKDADANITLGTAILHDIGRYKDSEGDHAYWSAEEARKILEEKKINTEDINKIVEIIKYHNSYGSELPKEIQGSLEYKILVDADRIDSFGPLGIIRAPLDKRYQKSYEEQIKHITQKADPNNYKLQTNGGMKIGKKYKDFLNNFLTEYNFQKDEFEK